MLYILPPPSAPSPPSPWSSILYGGSSNGGRQWGSENQGRRSSARSKLVATARESKDSGAGALTDEDETTRTCSKSLSECYFAGKGSAVVLPPLERTRSTRRVSVTVPAGCDIQQHLQSMFYLLRPEDTLKMAVKLESARSGRTRYLVVVSCPGRTVDNTKASSQIPSAPPPPSGDTEESCLLGIDCNERTTVGLVLRVLADTAITLDGDGGFKVSVCGCQHIFKPVSVQAMWSALQTLHRVSSRAREHNYFQGGLSHDWVSYYERRIESERSCLNEWHAMDNLESRRPPSPDSVRTKPRKRDETERVIRATLKEIMMSVDLDEVTSKYIRGRLEEDLDMDLVEFKPFIDQEMLIILGQMDAPTEVFDHVYLGSEWNASNLEELQKNGVRHILNVTREIDNFFPGMFDYLNVRVYDDEKTDLLKHWDNTYKYITRARKEGSKVLVHCKMGVSRSASVVIAYAMKAYNWDFDKALNHVKEKRNCIKPNTSFISQLETYQGILDAMKNKEKLQRSKSETNLKSPGMATKSEHRVLAGSEPTPLVQALGRHLLQTTLSGHDLSKMGSRPKSWSPDTADTINRIVNGVNSAPTSLSLEDVNREDAAASTSVATDTQNDASGENQLQLNVTSGDDAETEARNVLMPCEDGKIYSVSQNQIVHLPSNQDNESRVKNIVNELESQSSCNSERKMSQDRKGLVLNLTNHFQNASMKSLEDETEIAVHAVEEPIKSAPSIVKKEIWEPGDKDKDKSGDSDNSVSQSQCDSTINNSDSLVWTASSQLVVNNTNNDLSKADECVNKDNEKIYSSKTVLGAISNRATLPRTGDPFSAQLDRVFDREERKQQRNSAVLVPLPPAVTELSGEQATRDSPSRQSSWSSFDSAVVLSFQGEARDTPSRHSSWGSGDTRVLPSRNSSWGSYDMRPMQNVVEKGEKQDDPLGSSGIFPYDRDDIPWHPGTVKRTKQKLEQGSGASVKRICGESKADSVVDEITVVPNLNLRVHCPRPYQSTSPTQLQSNCSDNRLVEAINTTLVEQRELDEYNRNRFAECAIPSDIRINSAPLQYPRLSMSAPESSSMPLLGADSIKKCKSISASNISSLIRMPLRSFKTFSEATMNGGGTRTVQAPKRCLSVEESSPRSPDSDCSKNLLGLVKNKVVEFEAKSSTPKDNNKVTINTSAELSVSDNHNDSITKIKGRSLPSSPVSAHIEVQTEAETDETNEMNSSDLEDLSVKVLVGKYEVSKNNANIQKSKQRSIFENKQQTNQQVNRKSMDVGCIQNAQPPLLIKHSTGFMPTLKNGSEKSLDSSDFRRPPVPPIKNNIGMPNVVVASVVAKAERKKQIQHGKTQPLTRLAVNNTRHNNPMYNTM